MTMEVEEFLEHHGIKGMHWGIRKREDVVDKERSEQLKSKYGPDSMKDGPATPLKEQHGWASLSPNEKKVVLGVGGLALAGGALYLANRAVGGDEVKAAYKGQFRIEGLIRRGEGAISETNKGLAFHWEHGVNLPKGSVLQRMSSVKETEIRPGGFFAAFDKTDVERYKGEIPKYWPSWKIYTKDGYLTQLKSKGVVKAPSGKETFEMVKSLFDDETIVKHVGPGVLEHLNPDEKAKLIHGLAKESFNGFVASWAETFAKNDSDVQRFFKVVKGRGYNALIDFNDAGRFAKVPLRVIDGALFDISGQIPVSESEIAKAGAAVKELVMDTIDLTYEFLEHHGVKGMKWGIRNVNRDKHGNARFFFNKGERAQRKAAFKEVKVANAKNTEAFNKAAKANPAAFKREVKLTRKRKGIDITKVKNQEVTKTGGLLTNRLNGNFVNSKGEKVSEDFANAVLKEAGRKNARRDHAASVAVGAVVAGAFLAANRGTLLSALT